MSEQPLPAVLENLPDIGLRSPIPRALIGVRCVWQGLAFTIERPELRYLAAAAILINLVVFGGLLVGGWFAIPFFLDWLELESTAWRWVLGIALALVWAVLSIFFALLLSSVVASPFLEKLSERTERLLVGHAAQAPNVLVGAASAAKEVVLQLAFVLPFTLLVFLIGLIPLAGPPIALALSWTWASLWVSLSFVTPASTRHHLSAGERIHLIFSNKALFLGLGGIQSIFPWLLVPLCAPALAVAGTRIYLSLAAHGRVKSQLVQADMDKLKAV